jgi:mevalonate kinase
MEKFHSHGQLLLSGEYFILHGAKGLSIPLNVGQTMEVEPLQDSKKNIYWNVKDKTGHWFQATIDKRKLKIIDTDDAHLAMNLANSLKHARKMGAAKLRDTNSYNVHCTIGFNREFGLGSSAAFISNLGYWLKTDAMDLHFKISKGSGYDVASAQINLPVIYSLYKSKYPIVKAINFKPPFTDNLYFVYRGKKVNSSQAVMQFRPDKKVLKDKPPAITEITEKMEVCNKLDEFMQLMREHEKIVSDVLDFRMVKSYFADFKGELKSLGAWGGDFMLAATKENWDYVLNYFQQKNLNTIYPYKELALYY